MLQKLIFSIIFVLTIWSSALGQTEFGNNSTTASLQYTSTTEAWAMINSDYVFTAPSNGTVTELGAYMKSYKGGDFTAEIGIYIYSGGEPTTLVGSTTLTGNGGAATMYNATGLSISLTSGTVYCIAVGELTNGARLHANSDDAGSVSRQRSSATLGSTWDEFTTYANILCAYGSFTAGGAAATQSPRRRKYLQGDR